MARQLEFDRASVLRKATGVFWRKGFAGASTDDLLAEMGIGRQSMYNTFGDKRKLYLEVLQTYQDGVLVGHLDRLNGPTSPIEGVRALLTGIVVDDDSLRGLGCLGVGSVGEFGASDNEVLRISSRANKVLEERVTARLREAKSAREIDQDLDVAAAAQLVLSTMSGLQIAARAGATAAAMRSTADFTIDRFLAK